MMPAVSEMIYQLFVRHFGNPVENPVFDGSLAQNGCGKFSQINDKALAELVKFGFSHVWLTGVLEQASATAYPGRPADDPLLLKGKAGSPYAVRDYFDVSPDYADQPERRLEEFQALLERCAQAGLKVIIDFIPNHVARSYGSDQFPAEDFGQGDDCSQFFARDNNYYYLEGEGPMLLPGGAYPAESVGRVTGNNAATWQPSLNDWYETVKLNYGHDYRQGRDTSHLPGRTASVAEVPDTWRKMDRVLAYWQALGVDGFRCDMAHMVPMEFWAWAIRRAQQRDGDVYFMAEGYDGDPAKLTEGNVLEALLEAGFNTVYDGDCYELVKSLYEHGLWANDLDRLLWQPQRLQKMLRYAENHDEVRLASRHHWGAHGAEIGRPVTAFLSGVAPAPFMLYNGQEVGECGDGAEGFAGDDGRNSIFDYGHLPALSRWVNHGKCNASRLTRQQRALRKWYVEWLQMLQQPAFQHGGVYGLNSANAQNAGFTVGAAPVGQWLYAFLRYDPSSSQVVLMVLNFHPSEESRELVLTLPQHARDWASAELPDYVHVGVLAPCAVWTSELVAAVG